MIGIATGLEESMKKLLLALFGVPLVAGCVVRVHDHRPAPPPPPAHTTVRVTYGWHHVRWCVWTEYYGCSDDEVYYLERCGYDDDDVLVMCFIARQARVPLRWVVYEYDRCGRSLYTTAMVFRLDPFVFYCREVPRGHTGPGPYGRAYGYYWRGERHYLANDELHALVHLQIGIRYYGYTPVTYFQEYERCRARNEHPFRTVVVRDYSRCGSGGRAHDEKVIVKKDRPWDHSDVKEWEKKREMEREKVKVAYTPQKEKEEHEKARQAAEAPERKGHAEKVRVEVSTLKAKRADDDKRHPVEERKPAPAPPGKDDAKKPAAGPDKKPDAPPGKPADARKPEEKKPGAPPGKPAETKKPEPPKKPAEPKKEEGKKPEEKKGGEPKKSDEKKK
jgi:hypothetical protein